MVIVNSLDIASETNTELCFSWWHMIRRFWPLLLSLLCVLPQHLTVHALVNMTFLLAPPLSSWFYRGRLVHQRVLQRPGHRDHRKVQSTIGATAAGFEQFAPGVSACERWGSHAGLTASSHLHPCAPTDTYIYIYPWRIDTHHRSIIDNICIRLPIRTLLLVRRPTYWTRHMHAHLPSAI